MDFSALLIEAMQLALWLAAPTLAACVLVAVVMSFLQGSLQAHDPSVSFVPKCLAAFAALWLSRDFFSERLLGFASHMLSAMATLGR